MHRFEMATGWDMNGFSSRPSDAVPGHFGNVIAGNDNIVDTFTNDFGKFQIRESLFAGPGGFLKFESTWQVTDDGLRLTTVIPMGGP